MLKLRLSKDYVINLGNYEREGLRLAVLAQSGHGKSWAAACLVEDALEQGCQVFIVEPIAEWHTLKAKFPNVAVVGGEFQDLPLEAEFANGYVKTALDKGLSVVFNVGELETEFEQRQFVANILWSLYRLEQKYRKFVFLVLEEADLWAPQAWDRESKLCLARVAMIAKHGRKLGIFPILISQRPADLHKSVLSQANVFLFGKFTAKTDLEAVTWLTKKLGIPMEEKDLVRLSVGEWFLWDRQGLHRVNVRVRTTPHGASTPIIQPAEFTPEISSAIKELKKSLEEELERRRKELGRIQQLEAENERLKSEIEQLRRRLEIKESLEELLSGVRTQTGEIDLSKVKELEEALESERVRTQQLEEEVNRLRGILQQVRMLVEDFQSIPVQEVRTQSSTQIISNDLASRLDPYTRRLYDYLASRRGIPVTPYQLAVACGVSSKSSKFHQSLRLLKRLGLIRQEGRGSIIAN